MKSLSPSREKATTLPSGEGWASKTKSSRLRPRPGEARGAPVTKPPGVLASAASASGDVFGSVAQAESASARQATARDITPPASSRRAGFP